MSLQSLGKKDSISSQECGNVTETGIAEFIVGESQW